MTNIEEYYCLVCDSICGITALESYKTVILWICPNCQMLYDNDLIEGVLQLSESILDEHIPEIDALQNMLLSRKKRKTEENLIESDKN